MRALQRIPTAKSHPYLILFYDIEYHNPIYSNFALFGDCVVSHGKLELEGILAAGQTQTPCITVAGSLNTVQYRYCILVVCGN